MSTKSYTLADGTTATVDADENGVPFNEGMDVLTKAIKAKIDTSSGGGASSENINVTNSKELIKHFIYEIISGATIESVSDLDCFTIINIRGNLSSSNEIYIRLFLDNSNQIFNTGKVSGNAFKIWNNNEISFHKERDYSDNLQNCYMPVSLSTRYIKIIQNDASPQKLEIGCLLRVEQVEGGTPPPDCYHFVLLNIRLN